MPKHCPFLREPCKEGECAMHPGGTCLVTAYLQAVEKQYLESDSCESCQSPEDDPCETPEWLENISAEALADEIIGFKEKDLREADTDTSDLFDMFWETKGAVYLFQPAHVKVKIRNAEGIVKKKLRSLSAEAQMPRAKQTT